MNLKIFNMLVLIVSLVNADSRQDNAMVSSTITVLADVLSPRSSSLG